MAHDCRSTECAWLNFWDLMAWNGIRGMQCGSLTSPWRSWQQLWLWLVNVDRLVEDLQIWATVEFNFIELADRHSRISVIMPQKKNPYSLAFVRGVAREMIGRLAGTAALQATPSGQVDNRIFTYGSVPRALEQAGTAVSLLAGTLAGLTVNREVMAQRAGEGYSGAADLADVIMCECNLDARLAHRIVGQAVRLALDADLPIQADLLDVAAQNIVKRPLKLSNQRIAEIMNPKDIVQTRSGDGGASPVSVQAMIVRFRDSMIGYEDWLSQRKAHIETAEHHLIETATHYANTHD